jgi:hypothetical protein
MCLFADGMEGSKWGVEAGSNVARRCGLEALSLNSAIVASYVIATERCAFQLQVSPPPLLFPKM